MRSATTKATVLFLGGVLALGLLALAWMQGAGFSEALQGNMQNCPQAGKWAISVWSGDNGADATQAFATCGPGAVAAAYHLDPQTQGWLRWFADRPQLSNLQTLNDMQGVIALGALGAPAITPTVPTSPTPEPVEPIAGATYSGITSQGTAVEFTVASDGAHIRRWQVEFLWSQPCPVQGGTETGDTMGIEYPVGIPIEHNGFSEWGYDEFPPSTYEIWGVFSSSTLAEGEAQFTKEEIPGSPCDSGIIEWNASPQ
jgi:hypothetical protein